jgi:hypothetical protein
VLTVAAPLPDHMAAAIAAFGFDASAEIDPFPQE